MLSFSRTSFSSDPGLLAREIGHVVRGIELSADGAGAKSVRADPRSASFIEFFREHLPPACATTEVDATTSTLGLLREKGCTVNCQDSPVP